MTCVSDATSSGTGGTIAGTGKYLKDMDDSVLVVLSDPEGSGLYNKARHSICSDGPWPILTENQVKYGVMYDSKEKEGTKRRHQVDTVVEGMSAFISSRCPRQI